jgi:arabinogalactan oligomer/maltooligosaccharide transport system permease protein
MSTTEERPTRAGGSEPPRKPPPAVTAYGDRLAERLGSNSLTGLVAKLLFLGIVNAMAVYALTVLWPARVWTGVAMAVGAALVIDVVYLSRRQLPFKFLLPGTLVVLAFLVYPVLYTGYIAFTNYGTGNVLTKEQAIERVVTSSIAIPDDATRYQSVPLVGPGDELALLLTDPDGQLFLGTAEGLTELDEADVVGEGTEREVLGEWSPMTLGDAQQREQEVLDFAVPVDDPDALAAGEQGDAIGVQTFSTAAVAIQRIEHDEARDVMVDRIDGTEYAPVDGTYTAPDGEILRPGYRAVIGFDNFVTVLTSPAIRGPFLRVFAWTFAFAILSVVTTFVMGLGLALALNDPRLKGRRITRSLLIIPYALPSFMTALIWQGLLNQSFGPINRILGLDVPWLTSQAMAGALPKFSVLLVNLWLGFGYMFLITTGALQAIPNDMKEAAFVDGATGWQAFRRITLPLLLVAVGPLLIASFAFNFNNFNVVFLLTGGGPPIQGTPTPAGHTDLLISYSYRLAFEGGRGADFGLAAAIASVIFVLVAVFSWIGFKRTATLEEIN